MTWLDWLLIVLYLTALLFMSAWVGRGQESRADYYVGGRSIPWWAIGISTMATQTSVNSFVSIPAFVSQKDGGGLGIVAYELALPLAMIFVIAVLAPAFRRLKLISIYEFLEDRFDVGVRLAVSGIFLISRALATGVTVYATALVLTICIGDIGMSPFAQLLATIGFVGVFTIVYDTVGGMKAVIWSDVVQMAVLAIGLILCIYYAVDAAGGVTSTLAAFPKERWQALDWSWGVGDGGPTPAWAFLFGGFFLYASYYGTDQSQAQRQMSAPSEAGARRSLILNGLARFPLVALYIILGVALTGAVLAHPELTEALRANGATDDHLVPHFIVKVLPEGARALLVAALLAAAMSSLDSTLNALSAATMEDFVGRFKRLDEKAALWVGKGTTVCWGLVITGFALVVAHHPGTQAIVELINKIGSAFYGPVLAAFTLGLLTRLPAGPVLYGVVTGVAINIALWVSAAPLHFIWWNATGFVAAVLFAFATAGRRRVPERPAVTLTWLPAYSILVVAFLVILAAAWAAPYLAP